MPACRVRSPSFNIRVVKMVNKEFKNIYGKTINVGGQPIEPDAMFKASSTDGDIKPLLKNGYISEVKKDE